MKHSEKVFGSSKFDSASEASKIRSCGRIWKGPWSLLSATKELRPENQNFRFLSIVESISSNHFWNPCILLHLLVYVSLLFDSYLFVFLCIFTCWHFSTCFIFHTFLLRVISTSTHHFRSPAMCHYMFAICCCCFCDLIHLVHDEFFFIISVSQINFLFKCCVERWLGCWINYLIEYLIEQSEYTWHGISCLYIFWSGIYM